jgi:undecaprenyl phosphate-alpha-L-ara4FN deformylase
MRLGLRIDVDTLRGTRFGVPNLYGLLSRHSIRASFFFSVGPDNMGRHLLRLIRPAFLTKMMRTRASHLYGWDILLRGTLWPGPVIGERLGHVIRAGAEAGHEIGLHAWDHQAWQARLHKMDREHIHRNLSRGVQLLTKLLGRPPRCSAVPAWRCNDLVLQEKERFPFSYNSDCRGESIFRPLVEGRELSQPQIPTTLPTYDEVIGRHGITDQKYNEYLLSLLRPDGHNVLTIHAEVEGMACMNLFDRFVRMAPSRDISFVPLGSLLEDAQVMTARTLTTGEVPGREGWVACQGPLGGGRSLRSEPQNIES